MSEKAWGKAHRLQCDNVFQILNDASLHEQQIIDSAKLAKQIREVLEGA